MVLRSVLTLGLAAYAFSFQLSGETLSQGDRDFALSSLHATRKMFLDSIQGLNDAQWNFKAAPDRWSIAECAEHIILSEEYISGMGKKTAAGQPKPEAKLSSDAARAKDEKVVRSMADRSQKAQAPEPIKPVKHLQSPGVAAAEFRKLRDANIDYIDTTPIDLRAYSAPSQFFGTIDALQIFLMMSGHTERHTLQILEVKADPKFPK